MVTAMKLPWKVYIRVLGTPKLKYVSSHASGSSAVNKAARVGGFVVIPRTR